MSENTNLAERLHQILYKAKNISNGPMNCFVGWGRVFEIELIGRNTEQINNPNEQHPITFHYKVQMEILHRLFELNHLITEIEEKIKQVAESDYELYLNPFSRIRTTISPTRLTDNFSSILSEVTEGDMVTIRFCSQLLSKNFPEKSADEASLKELIIEIQDLYERINNSDLSYELKEILLDLLETMRQAIHEYRIRGISRLKEGIAEVLGKLILSQDLVKHSKSKEVTNFGKIVNKFIAIYSFAADTVQLLGAGEAVKGIKKLLDSGK